MASNRIYPVVLCGGSGTRLWPLSRKSYPKQFVQLIGDQSLFQSTLLRLTGPDYAPILVITGNDFRFIVAEQIKELGIENAQILIEPEGRNTAPAILAASLWIKKQDPNAVMLLSPSDHVMPEVERFNKSARLGSESAHRGDIVTFGIKPDRAETGYGWLELNDGVPEPVSKLVRFKEKPGSDEAKAMLASGNYLWNSGLFMFSVSVILTAFEQYRQSMLSDVQRAVDLVESDLDFYRLNSVAWENVESISIDYAIMEKASNISVVIYEGAWSDLGGWDSVLRESRPDTDGVAVMGAATAIDCRDSLLRSESESLQVVGIGLDNTMVVAMPDAVLVANTSHAQQVKDVVARLKSEGVSQAEAFPKDHRPWGWFETLALADRYQVKKIVVKPGGILSLQSHMHRSEHWIVVSGTARVTIAESTRLVSENESVYIPLGEKHRMENPGKLPMVLIEVQTGVYLGEDDIERFEDAYSR